MDADKNSLVSLTDLIMRGGWGEERGRGGRRRQKTKDGVGRGYGRVWGRRRDRKVKRANCK